MTDAKASMIVHNILLPAFRNGDYNGGVFKASDIIARTIAGEQIDIQNSADEKTSWSFVVIFLLFYFLLWLQKHFSGDGKSGGFGGFDGGHSSGGFSGGGGSFGGGGASGRW